MYEEKCAMARYFVFALLLLTGCKGSEQEMQKKNGESEDVSSKVEAFLKKETNQSSETTQLLTEAQCTAQNVAVSGHAKTVIDGVTYIENPTYGGLLYYLYQGVKLGIYPPLIFLGIGCMTDFGPLISNPKSLILGAAAQIGIFLTFTGAIFLGFTEAEAGAIGIIGGADGPTAIYVTTKLAPHLLGSIAIAAYSYMALVPIIQPPIMKALTTKKSVP
mgnify:CR=1 FL=1